MRTLAGSRDAEAVVGTIAGAMRVADEVSFARIPDIGGLAIVEPHGKMATFVLVRLGPVPRAQEDSLLVKGPFFVVEDDPLGGDFVKIRDTFHETRLLGASYTRIP
jgi:hypothetical protein